jgi:hypothetical protein
MQVDNPNLAPAASAIEVLPPAKPSDLAELARQACEAHAATGHAVDQAVRHALIAGRALIAAKKLVPDGQWTSWVQRNCDFTIRHAQRYIKLVEAYDADATRVSRDVLGLSLRAAIKRLTPTQRTSTARNRNPASRTRGATALEIAAVFKSAPLAERTRGLDNIGWRDVAQAIPESWLPDIERWVTERHQSPIPTH